MKVQEDAKKNGKMNERKEFQAIIFYLIKIYAFAFILYAFFLNYKGAGSIHGIEDLVALMSINTGKILLGAFAFTISIILISFVIFLCIGFVYIMLTLCFKSDIFEKIMSYKIATILGCIIFMINISPFSGETYKKRISERAQSPTETVESLGTETLEAVRGEFVFICTGSSAKTYHRIEDCRGLSRCSGDIEKVSLDEAEDMERRACRICY